MKSTKCIDLHIMDSY